MVGATGVPSLPCAGEVRHVRVPDKLPSAIRLEVSYYQSLNTHKKESASL
jgi:hypothetical protein